MSQTPSELHSTVINLCKKRKLTDVWLIEAALRQGACDGTIQLHYYHARVMAINLVAWEWLVREVERGYDVYVARDGSHWTSKIFEVVELMVITPDVGRAIVGSEFVADLSEDDVYTYTPSPAFKRRLGMEPFRIKSLVEDILRVWYKYTDLEEQLAKSRAIYLRAVVDMLGVEALYYQPVWNGYLNVRKAIGASSHLTPNGVYRWAHEVLKDVKAVSENSTERKMLREIANVYAEVWGGQLTLDNINVNIY